ncbi:2-dehydro-3-deoxygalactonokinase [Primorskyibacter sp. S87]|uniref:2-dehydro-3-deoxygalactonokinase n=1 Tax=Primorskyibacter sp. S87 TaxID=3415126 RepID=UPI003C7B8B46
MTDQWIGVLATPAGSRSWRMSGSDPVAELPPGDPLPPDWAGLPRLICGDDGDAPPTRPVPVKPLDNALSGEGSERRISGLHQDTPPVRCFGAETAIAGFLSMNANWDGVVCLPGHRTVWAHVSADEIVSFQTFATGEILDLLIRHGANADRFDEPLNEIEFLEAVAETLSRPERLAQQLAGLDLVAEESARSVAQGALIGAELAAARPFWLGQQIAVIGIPPLSGAYVSALRAQGAPVAEADSDRMTLAGLAEAWRKLQDT